MKHASQAILGLGVFFCAASFVRFEVIAIIMALAVGAVVSWGQARRRFLINACIVCLAVGAGYAANSSKTKIFASYAISVFEQGTTLKRDCKVGLDNSIAVRRKLIEESVDFIPKAGLVGWGLDGFQNKSCLSIPPHNSFAQALVEFGLIGGSA